jgi:hypothetical protein
MAEPAFQHVTLWRYDATQVANDPVGGFSTTAPVTIS